MLEVINMDMQKPEINQNHDERVGAELTVLNDTAADIHAELTAINTNLSVMLESLQVMEEKQYKLAKDIKSISAMLLFWFILTLFGFIGVFMFGR